MELVNTRPRSLVLDDVNNSDEFRRNAAECQRMANNARVDSDKAAWLRLAETWLRMIPKDRNQAASDKFDAQESAQGTGQKDSESSH